MPAPTFQPTGPSATATPPVMYSQKWSPAPSSTAIAPELRTQNRSPARPARNSRPPVAPYRQVLPARTGHDPPEPEPEPDAEASPANDRITITPPPMPLPT